MESVAEAGTDGLMWQFDGIREGERFLFILEWGSLGRGAWESKLRPKYRGCSYRDFCDKSVFFPAIIVSLFVSFLLLSIFPLSLLKR